MTIDDCHTHLVAIRRNQGTRCPLIRIDHGGSIYQGRLTRADSDPEHRSGNERSRGVLVLRGVGNGSGCETALPIDEIQEGGIRGV